MSLHVHILGNNEDPETAVLLQGEVIHQGILTGTKLKELIDQINGVEFISFTEATKEEMKDPEKKIYGEE